MWHITRNLEFPKALEKVYSRAIKYEWISFIYMISAAIFSFSVMSNSQTMKTVWLEDTLGIIPPASFLITSKIIRWKPTRNFPYGFHKTSGIAFLSSALALFALGIFLFCDGLIVLLNQEHPTIPSIIIFRHEIWLGFLMIVALLWSSIPSMVLGHIKLPLAHRLYDKVLYADSKMNKASWMSGFASILGIIGIGLGYWWADALAGIIISINIINDGFNNVKQAILDLLDEIPKAIGSNKTDKLISEVRSLIDTQEWITSAKLRFRDEGHVFFGDILVETNNKTISIDKIDELQQKILNINWRLHDIIIMPTVTIDC